jgi:hypothetical protein
VVGAPDQPALLMFSPDRGVALFEILSAPRPRVPPRRFKNNDEFLPNAAIVDAAGEPVKWITDVPRKGRMSSYFVQIERNDGAVRLICFRGEIFELELADYPLMRVGQYQKY